MQQIVMVLLSSFLNRVGNKESIVAAPAVGSSVLTALLATHFDAGTAEQLTAFIAAALSALVSIYQIVRKPAGA